ncbi:MAG: hypothetical protein Q8R79_08730 [Legionellaceae bacterium]|nr:hypothetical protein [Legionellaceae bacterium]
MSEESQVVSTYKTITAERLFDYYSLSFSAAELKTLLRHPQSFYHQLVKPPLQHIRNGLVMEQTNAYRVFGQKQFVDYLLSGEADKSEDSPGAGTRKKIEEARVAYIAVGEAFDKIQASHTQAITDTQRSLISFCAEWKDAEKQNLPGLMDTLREKGWDADEATVRRLLTEVLSRQDWQTLSTAPFQMPEALSASFTPAVPAAALEAIQAYHKNFEPLLDRLSTMLAERLGDAEERGIGFTELRTTLYDALVESSQMFRDLPDYRPSDEATAEHREALQFDPLSFDQPADRSIPAGGDPSQNFQSI